MIHTEAVEVGPELDRARLRPKHDRCAQLHGNEAELASVLVVNLSVGALVRIRAELPLNSFCAPRLEEAQVFVVDAILDDLDDCIKCTTHWYHHVL